MSNSPMTFDDFYDDDCKTEVMYYPPTPSAPASESVLSFDNDLQPGTPPQAPESPLTSSDIDRDYTAIPITLLDSFIPIVNHLPGLHLQVEQNLYYIRALSQEPELPFFPSLSDLIIINADESLSHLEFLFTPSLKSLEVSRIPDAQQPTLLTFLICLAEKVPLLQSLKLSPGRFSSDYLKIIPQFKDLRHLELNNEDLAADIPSAFFDDIGALSELETLILDARRYVSNITSGKPQPNCMDGRNPEPPMFENVKNVIATPYDSYPDCSPMDRERNEDGAGDSDILISPISHTPTSTSTAFSQLKKLHVTGWLPLLEDLIPRVMSTILEDVSITFIRLSDDELQANLAKEKEEKKREEMEKAKIERQNRMESFGNGQLECGCIIDLETQVPSTPQCEPSRILKKKKKKKGSELSREEKMARLAAMRGPEETQAREPAQEAQGLLKEVRDISFGIYTAPFAKILQMLCCSARWTKSLKTVSVSQLNRSFRHLENPPTLPAETLLQLLLLPAIENLEVKGWFLDSVEMLFDGEVELIPNLKSLLLPLDETNSGISLPTLRCVAEACPKLESFQCRIEPLSLIPEYPSPTTETLFHGLRTLSVGNSSPHPDSKKLYLIARHLDLLFPDLETITVSEGHNAEQWAVVTELVRMCQTARMDERYRASCPPRTPKSGGLGRPGFKQDRI